MAIYRFRVTFDDYDEVSRDIEIRPTQTFEDFHYGIQSAIGFDASKPASFYMSDDHWKKGKEITSKEISEDDTNRPADMSKARLCDFIADPHQKIFYIFDFLAGWAFRMELFKILPTEDPIATYPRCVKSVGDAPRQYAITTPESLPVPEDFDLDLDEETEEDVQEEILGTTEDELPEGVETEKSFTGAVEPESTDSDEFETAGDDMDDEIVPEGDDF